MSHNGDPGCGAGDYSPRASRDVGESGVVFAIDRCDELAGKITEIIKPQGIKKY